MIFTTLLLIATPIMLMIRVQRAKNDGIIGFILNPLLYLVVFNYLYLVLGSTLAYAGGYDLFLFKFSEETTRLSLFLTNYTMCVFIIFYYVSKDYPYVKIPQRIKYKSNLYFLIIISFLISLLFLYLIIKYGATIYSLHSMFNRVTAYDYFIKEILTPYRLIGLLNIALVIFITINLFSSYRILHYFTAVPFLLIIFLEVLQGGRLISMICILSMYIIMVIKYQKLYFKIMKEK